MAGAASGVTRGCGRRVAGGIYFEVETSPFGRPLEDFLLCPPVIVNTETLGITPIGVKLLQHKDGKHHVFDWVGAEHYPNVADFIEEAKRYGISRRASRTVEFSKITDGSRLVLLHSRAHINLHQMYQRSRLWPGCICGRPNHTDNAEYEGMCVGLYREDLDGGLPIADPLALAKELSAVTDQNARLVERAMPFGKYFGGQRPPDADRVHGRKYEVAIFASFPLGRIVVINDPDNNSHEEAMEKAKAAGVPVETEDE